MKTKVLTTIIVAISLLAIALAFYLGSEQGEAQKHWQTYLAWGFPILLTVLLLIRRQLKIQEKGR